MWGWGWGFNTSISDTVGWDVAWCAFKSMSAWRWWRSGLSGKSHTRLFPQETGDHVQFETKRHQSFPETNHMVFMPQINVDFVCQAERIAKGKTVSDDVHLFSVTCASLCLDFSSIWDGKLWSQADALFCVSLGVSGGGPGSPHSQPVQQSGRTHSWKGVSFLCPCSLIQFPVLQPSRWGVKASARLPWDFIVRHLPRRG